MTEAHPARRIGGASRDDEGTAAARGIAKWLSLTAAPTFAVMALLTRVFGGSHLDLLCSAAPHTSQLTGMVPMYLLMSVFHSAPWFERAFMVFAMARPQRSRTQRR
jgi:hypothetical protein